jgi:subtilisin family serine protease
MPDDPSKLPLSDASKKPFDPENLASSVIAIPLIHILREGKEPDPHSVIIDLNLEYGGSDGELRGRKAARKWVVEKVSELISKSGGKGGPAQQGINLPKSDTTEQYLFAKLNKDVIYELVRADQLPKPGLDENAPVRIRRAIYHIWPDFKIHALIDSSIRTVKADAARVAFSATGQGIVWAVMDSGIDETHDHFLEHGTLKIQSPLVHTDFTGGNNPLVDGFGHGTHVAGIVAGEIPVNTAGTEAKKPISAFVRQRDEQGEIKYESRPLKCISGMAPRCKLVSLKVLDDNGDGAASNLISAIAQIQQWNGNGRRLLIQGVNMSVGYDFDPEWFACGQSPLCVEVNRLVRSGVVVVVAAGNTGFGYAQSAFRGTISAGLDLTINDPGNAELAITVGSTHRDMPHVYGVSYFSSKGPTGDGRAKPDLVAPGEKILSCAAGQRKKEMAEQKLDCNYLEESGTSMAAPHVSGVIAAFLSVRTEFIGEPEKVKEIFLATATDLKREHYFQGRGLVDLMRAIQSI